MDRIAPPSCRTPRRSFTSVTFGASLLTLLLGAGACSIESVQVLCPPGQNCAASGGASSSGGGPGAGGGAVLGSGGASTGGSAAGGTVSAGGTLIGTGGTGTGGGVIGAGGGSGGTAEPPCVDTPYPYDPTWPEADCTLWKDEANACGEAWFAGYCDITCGRCTPTGGTGGSGGGTSGPPDCSHLPQVSGGDGFATRYWDCCQPHCAQNGGHKCNKDGTSVTGDNSSSCSGGGAFACYDDAPYAVDECVSYGHIAKANPNCGGCYRIQFTGEGHSNVNDAGSKRIKGKQMIVKVTNTGGDVAGNQFDMMIPGGGVGQYNACSNQWGTSDLGAQYGGFLAECSGSLDAKKECVRQECQKIPAGDARDGCLWFVDWFEVADNPTFTSQQVDCPF